MNLEPHMSLSMVLVELLEQADHRLIIDSNPFWITVRTFTPSNRWLIEVSCNKNLHIDHKLSPEQEESLLNLGYKSRRQGYSIGKLLSSVSIDQIQHLALEIEHILGEIFSSPTQPSFSVLHSPSILLYNRELLAKMKESARSKDHQLRLQLYTLFIDCQFIALTDSQNALLKCDTIQKLPCFGVFTDEKHALQYNPRGQNLSHLSALDVIQKCIIQGAGSLWINPKGETRGELYKNELDGLWQRIRRIQSGS